MPSIYLTYLSILLLITPIFNLFILVYLIRTKDKSRALNLLTWVLAISFLAYSIKAGESLLYPYPIWFTYVRSLTSVIILIVGTIYLQFAYICVATTPEFNHKARRAGWISAVLVAIGIIETWGVTWGQLPEAFLTSIMVMIVDLSIIFVLTKRFLQTTNKSGSSSWGNIIRPSSRSAEGIRAFLLIYLLLFAVNVSYHLTSFEILPSDIFRIFEIAVTLLANFFIVIIALDYLDMRVPLMIRITAATLTVILTTVSGMSLIFGPNIVNSFQVDHEGEITGGQTYSFTPNSQGGYRVERIRYQFIEDDWGEARDMHYQAKLPFSFPFFGQEHQDLVLSPEGAVLFRIDYNENAYLGSLTPAITPMLVDLNASRSPKLYYHISTDQATITWQNRILERDENGRRNTYQLTLHQDGSFLISFKDVVLSPPSINIEGARWFMMVDPGLGPRAMQRLIYENDELPFTTGAGQGFGQDDYFLLREEMHESMSYTVLFIIILIVGLVLYFSYFFQRNVNIPLGALIDAIQDVDDGDLDKKIEPFYKDELGKLTLSFNHMVDSLRKNDQLKDEFLANTSHELRTPLNGMIGIAESLMDGIAGEMSPEAQANLEMIVSSGHRLTGLVSDILDFSKLKNQDIELITRPFYLHSLTEVVLTVFRALVGERPLYLHNDVSEELVIVADENRIQQILYNLVGNALKFTPEGGVTVSANKQGEWVAIHVEDTGIGIRPEQQKLIFTSFVQGDGSTDRRYPGTGLGLSITKRLVEIQGGEIKVTSQPGEGSTFTFTVPAGEANQVEAITYTALPSIQHIPEPLEESAPSLPQGRQRTKAMLSAPTSGFRILVVDDEPVNLQVINNHLTTHNYHVTQALDGEHALHLIRTEEPFDMVILDVMMPRMSGYEVCSQIREQHDFARHQLPVIMLTAKTQTADLIIGFESGANDYLIKPFSKDELLTRIKTHLQLAQTNISYSRFVPSEYLKFLQKESIIDVNLGDHVAKEMAVMFSDIRSFTTISESMTSQENFDFVNAYLRRVSPKIRQNDGFIVKYLGDGMMAVFPNGADSALKAAIEKLEAVHEYNISRQRRNRNPIRVGVGIHMGPMMVGMVGESNRMQGDAFSDHVNLTARLESLTKTYGISLVISEYAYSQLSDPQAYKMRFLDRVVVKGRSEPIGLYEVLDGLSAEQQEKKWKSRDSFADGIKRYQAGDLGQAKILFTAVQAINPDDVTVDLYLERIAQLQKEGLPENWDGVWRLQSK